MSHGVPQELPPAYVPPAYIASAKSLDQPGLGLVLVFAALLSLPHAVSMMSSVFVLGAFPKELLAMGGLMFATATLQAIAGLAIAWQWRSRAVLYYVFLACGAALVACAFVVWREELGVRQAGIMALETLGGPLLVLFAPRLFGLHRITHGHALGGLLIVSALATFIYEPVYILDHTRALAGGANLGAWLGFVLNALLTCATATLQLVAGLRMARGQSAYGWIVAYVAVAIVGHCGWLLIAIVEVLRDEWPSYPKMIIANSVAGFVVGITRSLVVLSFAKREDTGAARIDAALPWLALWLAPILAARCLFIEELDELVLGDLATPIVVLCAIQALACLAAGRAALRDEGSVWAWRVAAGVAALVLAIVVYWVFKPHDIASPAHRVSVFDASRAVWPVGLLFATMFTGAWLAGRVTSQQ